VIDGVTGVYRMHQQQFTTAGICKRGDLEIDANGIAVGVNGPVFQYRALFVEALCPDLFKAQLDRR